MRPISLLPLCCVLGAVEGPTTPEGWSHSGRLAALLSDIGTTHADTSRDATIAGTSESISWKLAGSGRLMWKAGSNEVQQDLKLEFGKQKQEPLGWRENADEVRYDGIYRRVLSIPHFVYTGWGAETVFTGPEPERDPFEPGRGWSSVGYGQKYENILLDDNDRLEGRIGVRGSKRWGKTLTENERELETGPEWFGRYEATIGKLMIAGAESGAIKGYLQYEGWSEFDDMGHVTHLLTSGLFVQFTKYLTLDVGYRGYFESAPEDAAPGAIGYDQWSARREVLIGATYLF